MSQISKCPNITVMLTYWEPSREVSELRYKSLLFNSSRWSYCRRPWLTRFICPVPWHPDGDGHLQHHSPHLPHPLRVQVKSCGQHNIKTYWPVGGGRGQNPGNTAQGQWTLCPEWYTLLESPYREVELAVFLGFWLRPIPSGQYITYVLENMIYSSVTLPKWDTSPTSTGGSTQSSTTPALHSFSSSSSRSPPPSSSTSSWSSSCTCSSWLPTSVTLWQRMSSSSPGFSEYHPLIWT